MASGVTGDEQRGEGRQPPLGALRAAFSQVAAAQREVGLSHRLRAAEERELVLGTSNLLDVKPSREAPMRGASARTGVTVS